MVLADRKYDAATLSDSNSKELLADFAPRCAHANCLSCAASPSVPRGGTDGQGMGDLEPRAAPSPVGDGESKPPRRLQDQEDLQEIG